jgi:hypothetical protein
MAQSFFPAAGVLPGNQTQISRHFPPTFELSAITHGRHQGAGHHRAHTLYRQQPFYPDIIPCRLLKPTVMACNPLIQYLQLFRQFTQQTHKTVIPLFLLRQYLRQCLTQLPYSRRQDQAELSQQAPYLIAQGCPRTDEPGPDAVLCLQRLLPFRFDSHEAHAGAADSLTDSVGIVGIILLAFKIGFNPLRRDNAYSMPQASELAGPVV